MAFAVLVPRRYDTPLMLPLAVTRLSLSTQNSRGREQTVHSGEYFAVALAD